MTIEYPGSTEVVEPSEPDSIFIDDEKHDFIIEVVDGVALVKLDEPIEFSLTYNGEPLEDSCIEVQRFGVNINDD